jgi:hypothetical protein
VPTWLSTTRIGPLTGPADQNPPPLQDTRRWEWTPLTRASASSFTSGRTSTSRRQSVPAAPRAGEEVRPARRRKAARTPGTIEIALKSGDQVRVEAALTSASWRASSLR